MKVYHAGFDVIRKPDIHYGRANADFGQGFYLSDNREFAARWAKERKQRQTYINLYELTTAGLKIKRFARDEAWFHYLYRNRNGYADSLADYDVIIGPIANDTLYDIWGITTAGLLSREQSLEILSIGPAYEQIVLKSEAAVGQLQWIEATELSHESLVKNRETLARKESDYQQLVESKLEKIAQIE